MISPSYSFDPRKGLGKGVVDLFILTSGPFSQRLLSQLRGRRGEENALPANSNRQDSNLGPFGPQSNALTT